MLAERGKPSVPRLLIIVPTTSHRQVWYTRRQSDSLGATLLSHVLASGLTRLLAGRVLGRAGH
jgi:hypothetical protein